jgi:hypothetical protein
VGVHQRGPANVSPDGHCESLKVFVDVRVELSCSA